MAYLLNIWGGKQKLSLGFTLTEMLIVISILTILIISSLYYSPTIINRARANRSRNQIQELVHASLLYNADVGFFPPDVGRGMDPGIENMFPTNVDTGAEISINLASPSQSHLPANWHDIVAEKWSGPYIDEFPDETPWKGEYDFNMWPSGAGGRYTNPSGGACPAVPPGLYLGTQRNSADTPSTAIPQAIELLLSELGLDDDNCINGEVQTLILSLD